MTDARLRSLRLPPVPAARRRPARRVRLGQLLVRQGAITSEQLIKALHLQLRLGAPLGDILVAEGWARRDQIEAALAEQFGTERADLAETPPDPALTRLRPPRFWLHHGAVPWRRSGQVTWIATARPERFAELRAALRDAGGHLLPALAPETEIQRAIVGLHADRLARDASRRVPRRLSCRGWKPPAAAATALTLALIAATVALRPGWALALALTLAMLTLAMFSALRLAGLLAHLRRPPPPGRDDAAPPRPAPRLPRISVLVPLHREREIAAALVARLERLTYPRALLEVILVLEQEDETTREALAAARLPPWMRIVEVPPHGGLTTKPRAMNYALDFCRGEIIGIWDAEDAPEPDQLERVARRFAEAPPDVACLQGILDFYNPRSNWRARCFTIEYAGWFRVVLRGIARLGLVVPLGGTTLFIRRQVLEEVGGWDAHNVTEDADLGVRLARAGWRTEVIDTVTFEEANHRAWPWVRQRTRWLKGFMITWLVHMRRPRRLWRDLGPRRFLGLQAFFLGTLGQFLLAPLWWSFWPMALGLPHPAETVLPAPALEAMMWLLLGSETLALAVGLVALTDSGRRFLIPWLTTMFLYYPLGVIAAYRALAELFLRPHFWDKTSHGQAPPESGPGKG